MYAIKCLKIASVLLTIVFLVMLIPGHSAAETPGIFRYLIEPMYRPVEKYSVKNFNIIYGENEGLLGISDDTGRMGVLDITGKLVVEPVYDYINGYRNGFFKVEKNGRWGFIDRGGREVIAPQYDVAAHFSEGLACVVKDGKYGYIDRDGTVVIPFKYDDAGYFSDGISRVYLNGKVGYVDKSGVEVITPKYDWIEGFNGNYSKVRNNGKTGYIDKKGVEVVPLAYDDAGEFSEGLMWVKKDGKYGFVDETGRVVISLQYDFVGSFSEGLAVAKKGDKYGYLDKSGRAVIPFKYCYAASFSEGLAVYYDNTGRYGFIDTAGTEIIPCKYGYANSFKDGKAAVFSDSKAIYIDKNGNNLFPQYDYVGKYSEGLAVVLKDNKAGYIDITKKEVIAPQYTSTLSVRLGEGDFKNGIARVEKNGKYGYIDKEGNSVVPLIYDDVSPFDNGLAVVFANDRCGLVNKNGTVVLPIIFEEIGIYDNENVFIRLNGRIGIASVNGAGEIPWKMAEPGESFTLPIEKWEQAVDLTAAADIITGFTLNLSNEQKESPVGIDNLTVFAEEAVARAVMKNVDESTISISRGSISEFEYMEGVARMTAENSLLASGILPVRKLFTTLIINAPQSEQIVITIEESASDTSFDYIRIVTPEFGVALPGKTLKANGPFTVTLTKISPIKTKSEDNYNHRDRQTQLGNTAEGNSSGITGFQYEVTFNKAIDGNVRLLLPPVSDETDCQTVFSADGTVAGGRYHPSNGWVDVKISTSGVYNVIKYNKEFSDIGEKSDEMKKAIGYLASRGIINGISATEFSPDENLTRAQIAALVVRMLNILNENEDGRYTDVKKEDWFFGIAGSAKKHRIMQGTGEDTFSPELYVSKEQAIVIAMRILKEEMGYKPVYDEENGILMFSDWSDISSWAKDDIILAVHEKLVIPGYMHPGLYPSEPITRGEAAVLLYRLYKRLW